MTMRPPTVVVFLVVMHLLLSAAYGARIRKFGIKSAKTQHTNLELDNKGAMKQDDDHKAIEKGKLGVRCKEDHEDKCASSQGKNRKLVASTSKSISASRPIQESVEKGENKVRRDTSMPSWMNEDKHRHASSSSAAALRDKDNEEERKQKVRRKRNEDLMDMIEMDYSPAKRKPPIHN